MRFKFVGRSLGLLLCIYSLLRFAFFYFHSSNLLKQPMIFIAQSFINGLRFDISALLMVNAIFILLVFFTPLVWFRKNIFQKCLHFFFFITNVPFLLANIADIEYYKFTGRRMGREIFLFRSEAGQQVDQFLVNYWYLFLIAGILFYALYAFYPRPHFSETPAQQLNLKSLVLQQGLTFFILIFIFVFGIRGGFQPKPLQTLHAHSLAGVSELGGLVLNSTFTLLKSRSGEQLKPILYFSPTDVVTQLKSSQIQSPFTTSQPQNIVILIVESLATEFWGIANNGKGHTPFLDSLAKKSLFLKNNFANGRRSIDALPAVLFGIPAFMNTPFVKTQYHRNQWNGLGQIAKRAGRHTSFFHGAPRGTMYFDAISAMAGLDDYYPYERYPKQTEDFDGHWGIYDEPFLQFAAEEISQHPEPFLSTIFTISTHQPYHVPSKYEKIFPRGTLKIHQSVRYVDHSLEQFFKTAKKKPWFKNTLFIITGDHTQMSESENYETPTGRYRVPLLLYHPTLSLPEVDPLRVTQHVDILPTLLDFMNIKNEPYLLFGHSLFSSQQEGEAVFFIEGRYWLVHQDYFIEYNISTKQSSLFSFTDAPQLHPILNKEDLRLKMEKKVKLYIQYYNNHLIENSLYAWHPYYAPQQQRAPASVTQ